MASAVLSLMHTHRSSRTFKDSNFALVECAVQGLHKLLLDVIGLVGKWKLGPAILHAREPLLEDDTRVNSIKHFSSDMFIVSIN